jgi:putative ABC transport system ATP-binding protein
MPLTPLPQTVGEARHAGTVRESSNEQQGGTRVSVTIDVGSPALATAAVRAEDVHKTYGEGEAAVHALRGVTCGFSAGGFTAVMGPSGSGKSTMMHCLAGLDRPDSGRIHLGDDEITGLDEKQRTLMRRDRLGFMFQAFNLVPSLTARENLLLPLSLAGRQPDPAWLDELLDTTGLRPRLDHTPAQLSGGQQQRVAAARAFIGKPQVVFADEPTGNLDSRSSGELLEFMRRAVDRLGQTIVMVTHDPHAASHADAVVFLVDGRIEGTLPAPTVDRVLEHMKQLEG